MLTQTEPARPDSSPQPRPTTVLLLALCTGLIAATLTAYGSFAGFEFISYDDGAYVTANPQVRAGLTAQSARWALTATAANNWHPLTWLSHMLDVQLFGLDPVAHRRVNLGLHVLATLLLFLALARMTRAAGRSALVAGLFALHPLHVESVAWIAERKDVLSGLCFAGTLWLWVRYAQRPSLGRYLAVVAAFVAGLSTKAMLVTLPAVLLLLDLWPLERLRLTPSLDLRALRRLLLEKLPLLALSAVVSLITLMAQQPAISLAARYTATDRLANALVSYVRYLASVFWPAGLSVAYAHPGSWPASVVLVCVLLLLGISVWCLRLLSTRPFLTVGWLWFLGTLVPAIGLIQVGEQALADRYTYLPSIGLFLMCAWGVPSLLAAFPWRDRALVALGLVVLSICAGLTRAQVAHWRSSETLWTRALVIDPDSALAHEKLGLLAYERGQVEQALDLYERAVMLAPERQNAQYNLGNLLMRLGRSAEAIGPLREAVRIRPDFARAFESLGHAYRGLGESDSELQAFRRAVEIDPDSRNAQYNLGVSLLLMDRPGEALAPLQESLRRAPGFAPGLEALATAQAGVGHLDAAVLTAENAQRIAAHDGDVELVARLETLLERLREVRAR